MEDEEEIEVYVEGEGTSTEKLKRVYGRGEQGRCRKSSAKKTYSKKRKYHPPKNPVRKETVPADEAPSTSHRKVADVSPIAAGKKEELDGYRFFHLGVLQQLVGGLLCPDCCDQTLCIDTDVYKRKGLASYIIVKWICGFSSGEYSLPINIQP